MMDGFKPEPDEVPLQPYRRTPMPCEGCGVTVQTPGYKKPVLCRACFFARRSANAAMLRESFKCAKCGAARTRKARLCDSCYRASRKMPGRCRSMNCANKARRGGYCERHARERMQRQVEAQA